MTHCNTGVDRRGFLKTAAAVGGTVTVAGCMSNSSGGNTVTFGLLQPFTGEVSWVGESSEIAVEIAVDEINEAGGANGNEIEVVTEDTEASQQTATSAIRKLIDSDNASVILGPTSFTLPAVMNIAQDNEVSIISPTAGTSELDDVGGEYIFRTASSDSLGGRAMARIADMNDYDEIAVMYVDDQGGRSFGQTVIEGFEALGGTVTSEVAVTPGKSSYRSELTKAFEGDPEFISLTAGTETGSIILNQWEEQSLGGVWGLSDDMQNSDFVSEHSGILEGSYAIGPLAGGKKYEEFANKYESRADEGPRAFTAEAYDAALIAALASEAAASTNPSDLASRIVDVSKGGEAVGSYQAGVDALGNDTEINYEGASGPVDFTDKGNIRSPFAVFQGNGGSWEQINQINPDQLEF